MKKGFTVYEMLIVLMIVSVVLFAAKSLFISNDTSLIRTQGCLIETVGKINSAILNTNQSTYNFTTSGYSIINEFSGLQGNRNTCNPSIQTNLSGGESTYTGSLMFTLCLPNGECSQAGIFVRDKRVNLFSFKK